MNWPPQKEIAIEVLEGKVINIVVFPIATSTTSPLTRTPKSAVALLGAGYGRRYVPGEGLI